MSKARRVGSEKTDGEKTVGKGVFGSWLQTRTGRWACRVKQDCPQQEIKSLGLKGKVKVKMELELELRRPKEVQHTGVAAAATAAGTAPKVAGARGAKKSFTDLSFFFSSFFSSSSSSSRLRFAKLRVRMLVFRDGNVDELTSEGTWGF